MRKYRLLLLALLHTAICYAQKKDNSTEQVLQLEQKVVESIKRGDSITLKQLWAPEFLVNNPRNKITGNRDSVLISQANGMMDYSNFERIVERVQIQKNIIITMGREVFVSRRDIPEAKAGQSYQRRFTNIWMKKKGRWQQIARHASIICQ